MIKKMTSIGRYRAPLFVILCILWLGSIGAAPCVAQPLYEYTYTGPQYTSGTGAFASEYTMMSITFSFVAPAITVSSGSALDITSWTMSDGLNSFSGNGFVESDMSPNYKPFAMNLETASVSALAYGLPTAWSFYIFRGDGYADGSYGGWAVDFDLQTWFVNGGGDDATYSNTNGDYAYVLTDASGVWTVKLLSTSPVPEPSCLLLLCFGIAGWAGLWLGKKKLI